VLRTFTHIVQDINV